MKKVQNYLLNIDDYPYKSWGEKFPEHTVNLNKLKVRQCWKELIKKEMEKDYWGRFEKYLSQCLQITGGEVRIYPYPDLVFNAFNTTSLEEIKVVILGQDPYHKNEIKNKKIVPQAMGLSFSVPVGVSPPSSLQNIYKNQLKYDQIIRQPAHGNLISWAYQGCMMLNTSLTVQHGYPNIHSKFWNPFTDEVIKYISNKCENIVFVLWGASTLNKLYLIDHKKHKIIISSHPSGLSCTKTLRSYSAFINKNHFGEINEYLKKNDKTPIVWEL